VRVSPGEVIPVDGSVLAGESAVNQATVTCESLPRDVAPGAGVFAMRSRWRRATIGVALDRSGAHIAVQTADVAVLHEGSAFLVLVNSARLLRYEPVALTPRARGLDRS
jgi:cation transport ATPase